MKKLNFILLLTFLFSNAKSQTGPYHFWFIESNKEIINTVITSTVSIDKVKKDTVFAYANENEMGQFLKLGYKYCLIPRSSSYSSKTITMASTIDQMANWDKYPYYEVYRAMMKKFQQDYPDLCKLDSIGTSASGDHKIYVLKLSSNVSVDEAEPEVFYTSTIHGDEVTGFVLMLRLIDYLLSNYGVDSRVTSLMNSMAIYINPNANPDGTYCNPDIYQNYQLDNHNIVNAVRYNKNDKDLNRSFPDPRIGVPSTIQPEVQTMMDFAAAHHFTLSVNFHGGAEVVNYPWDTWTSSSKTHADNNWYVHFSKQYADSVHYNGPSGYFTDVEASGITEGGDWYVITGGRQDYMNWWHHCREITIEISEIKMPSSDQLPNFWNYNKGALLSYFEAANQGFKGIVKNTSGDPVKAEIFITAHDMDSSYVYSNSTTGFYTRPIEPGTWEVTYSAFGYYSQTKTITISDWNSLVTQDVVLEVDPYAGVSTTQAKELELTTWPNPFKDYVNIQFNLKVPLSLELSIYSVDGRKLQTIANGNYPEGVNTFKWIPSPNQNTGVYIVALRINGKTSSQIIQLGR